MPEIAELSTKFGFDIDSRGVKKFEKTIGGMESKIAGLAGAIGVAFGGKTLFEGALDLSKLTHEAQLFGAEVDKDGNLMGEFVDQIERAKGFGGKILNKQTLKAFVDFSKLTQGLPKIQKRFGDFFEMAALINRSTLADDFGGIFTGLVESVRSGNVEILKGLPGISDLAAEETEKLLSIFKGADFFTVQGRGRALNALIRLFEKAKPRLEAALPLAAVNAKAQATEAKNALLVAFEKLEVKLTPLITKMLGPLTDFIDIISGEKKFPALEEILSKFKLTNDEIENVKTNFKALQKTLSAGTEAVSKGLDFLISPKSEEENQQEARQRESLRGMDELGRPNVPRFTLPGQAPQATPQSGTETSPNQINNINITLNGIESGAMAKEAVAVFRREIGKASFEFSPVEGVA